MREPSPSANKALGQHFLRDRRAVARMIDALPAHARVLEIGPGPGALTKPLLDRGHSLAVIEKDDRFAAHWRAQPGITVFHDDVLTCLPAAVAQHRPTWIIGNLPYNISGPLTALLAGIELSGGMLLMYQREVAERICAEAGSKSYGGLSVLVRYFYTPEMLFRLPPGAFSPPPKVHSAVVRLRPHHQPRRCAFTALQRAVRQGFRHRRKTIANNFRGLIPPSAWQALGIDPALRPEQLALADWLRLAERLAGSV